MQKSDLVEIIEEENVGTNGAAETEQLGHKLAQQLKAGDVLAFFGDLGSGKTTLIKGICKGLEIEEDITSPTFTLIHEYSGRFHVYHFDFYRIVSSQEVWELGCDEYFDGDGICIIEWPERIDSLLPLKRREVYLRILFDQEPENIREIRIPDREDTGN